jgi:hypothetical protein
VEAAAAAFLQMDEIGSLEEIKEKLDRSCMPSGIVEKSSSTELVFLNTMKDDNGIPTIGFYLQINDDLTFECW